MNLQETGTHNPAAVSRANRLTAALLTVYLAVLHWILLLKLGVQFTYMKSRSVNLVPFSEPLVINGKADMGEIILNVIIFVPLGIYAGVLFDRWLFGKKVLFFSLVSLYVEGLQYALAVGAFDITDIITNTFGGMIGLLMFLLTARAFANRDRAQKIINLFAVSGTLLMLVLLLLLKLNLLPVRYQ